ncbi:MAG: hypothetical protein QM758_24595, partial [Armatimonas sp.]
MSMPDYRRVISGPNRVYWYCLAGLMGWAVARDLGVEHNRPKGTPWPLSAGYGSGRNQPAGPVHDSAATNPNGGETTYPAHGLAFCGSGFLTYRCGSPAYQVLFGFYRVSLLTLAI